MRHYRYALETTPSHRPRIVNWRGVAFVLMIAASAAVVIMVGFAAGSFVGWVGR